MISTVVCLIASRERGCICMPSISRSCSLMKNSRKSSSSLIIGWKCTHLTNPKLHGLVSGPLVAGSAVSQHSIVRSGPRLHIVYWLICVDFPHPGRLTLQTPRLIFFGILLSSLFLETWAIRQSASVEHEEQHMSLVCSTTRWKDQRPKSRRWLISCPGISICVEIRHVLIL